MTVEASDKSSRDFLAWLYSPTFRGIASQIAVVSLILWGLYVIVGNTQANLLKLNQNFMEHQLETQLVSGALLKLRLAITGRPS